MSTHVRSSIYVFSAGQPVDKDEEKDSFNTRMTSSGIPEFENKKPIKCK